MDDIDQLLASGQEPEDLTQIVSSNSAPVTQPTWEPLAQQISQQWQQYGINPDIKGINRANELAQILYNYGITDISKLGIKETPYEELVNLGYGGENAVDDWQKVTKTRGQLTYGDKTFGRLGGFGSGGEKEFSAPQEYLQQSDPGRYGLSYSAAGKGWTDYEVVVRPDGTPVIVPKWGSSSDVTPELIQFLSIAAMPFTGGLSSSLGSMLGSKVAGQIAAQALISGGLGGLSSAAQGEGFGKGFGKGAITGGLTAGIGQLASPYINTLASDASKLVGEGTFGDIAAGAIKGAAKSGIGAVITGDSVLDAILTGATSGAASAGTDLLIKGTNSTLSEYLKDVPAPIKNAVLSAASAGILGKDIDKAVVNSFMRDLMGQFKEAVKKGSTAGQAASAGYGGAETEGFFDSEEAQAVQDDIDSILARYPETGSIVDVAGTADDWYQEGAIPVYSGVPEWDDALDAALQTGKVPGEVGQTITTTARQDNTSIDPWLQPFLTDSSDTQVIDITGTLPKKDVIIPDWDIMEEPDRTPGSPTDTTPQPPTFDDDRTVGTTPATSGTGRTGGTGGTRSTTPAQSGLDYQKLAYIFGLLGGQRPEEEEEYQAAQWQPLDRELMYGLRG